MRRPKSAPPGGWPAYRRFGGKSHRRRGEPPPGLGPSLARLWRAGTLWSGVRRKQTGPHPRAGTNGTSPPKGTTGRRRTLTPAFSHRGRGGVLSPSPPEGERGRVRRSLGRPDQGEAPEVRAEPARAQAAAGAGQGQQDRRGHDQAQEADGPRAQRAPPAHQDHGGCRGPPRHGRRHHAEGPGDGPPASGFGERGAAARRGVHSKTAYRQKKKRRRRRLARGTVLAATRSV